MHKGVSAVIAVVLLLLITISVVGLAFLFLTQTQRSAQTAGESAIQQQTSQLSTAFSVEGVSQNQVYVRNTGSTPLANLTFYVNNVNVPYTGPVSVPLGQVGVFNLDPTILSALPSDATLKVTGGFSAVETQATFSGSDTAPPILSNGAPTGTLPSGTTQTTISLDSSEAATCKYSTTPGVAYASMANTFTTTGGTSHSTLVTGLSNGNTYTYYVRCIDLAGNANTNDFLITFSVGTPDTTPPTTSITRPLNNTVVNLTLTVNATASDNVAVAYVELYKDNAFFLNDSTPPYQYVWNTSLTPNGAHVLRTRAVDTSGNFANSQNVTVTVNNIITDTTPPTTSISQPANGATVSGTLLVNVTASDNAAVAYVELRKDGAFFMNDSTPPYQYSWDTTLNTNGAHTIRSRAVDTSGNIGLSTIFTVTVNNPAVIDFSIQNVDKNTVTIMNTGTAAITSMSFTVASVPVNFAGPAQLNATQSAVYYLNDSTLSQLPDPAPLSATSGSVNRQVNADFYGKYTVSYWKFDEGFGNTTADSSGNGNTANFATAYGPPCAIPPGPNCPQWVAGKYGNALHFVIDGAPNNVLNYLLVRNKAEFNITENLTLQAWVKFDSPASGNVFAGAQAGCGNIIGRGSGVTPPPVYSYQFGFACANMSITGFVPKYSPFIDIGYAGSDNNNIWAYTMNRTTAENRWIHYVETFNFQRGVMGNFVTNDNVTQISVIPSPGRIINSTAGISIASYFNGTLDEVRILNVTRTMNFSTW